MHSVQHIEVTMRWFESTYKALNGLAQVLVMLEDFKEPAPVGAELEAFLSAPKHHLARLIRDLFSEEASATSMEVNVPAFNKTVYQGCQHLQSANFLAPHLQTLCAVVVVR
jgi:hypothetical protein